MQITGNSSCWGIARDCVDVLGFVGEMNGTVKTVPYARNAFY